MLLAEIAGLCSGCDLGVAVIHAGALCRIGASGLRVFRLSLSRGEMPLTRSSLLFRSGTRLNPAAATIEADAAVNADVDPLVVDVMEAAAIEVVDGAVVKEVSAIPTAATVASAPITEAVIDAAVEADGRAPVALIEEIAAVAPTPIAGGPEDSLLRAP